MNFREAVRSKQRARGRAAGPAPAIRDDRPVLRAELPEPSHELRQWDVECSRQVQLRELGRAPDVEQSGARAHQGSRYRRMDYGGVRVGLMHGTDLLRVRAGSS